MDDVVIRTAQPDDHAALAEVFRSASLSNDGDRDGLLAHREFLEFADTAIVERRVRLAEVDGEVVGFATLAPVEGADDALELEDLFVRPDRMRQGIATRLIADAGDRARAAGASRIVVTANDHARAFYRSVGFDGAAEVRTELGTGLRLTLLL